MLDSRDYMRRQDDGNHWWQRHPAWLQIIVALAVVFVFDQVNMVYLHYDYRRWLYLTPLSVSGGYLWQLLTFQFFHAGFLHLFFNALAIYFFGRLVEDRLGRAGFLRVYFLGGVSGGVLQSLLMWLFPQHFGLFTVGASAGVFAVIAAFAMIDPGAEILLYFVIPVKMIWFLYAETAISLFFTLVPSEGDVAHAAHLGGIAFAFAYMRWDTPDWLCRLKNRLPSFRRKPRQRIASRAIAKVRKVSVQAAAEVTPQEFISSEVDPILDKISAHGIQSLTDKEREILQNARDKMSRR